jgi:hypothetical protein
MDGDVEEPLLPPVISGPNASDFTVTYNPCTVNHPANSAYVANQGPTSAGPYYLGNNYPFNCNISVTFNPTAIGPRTATFTEADSAGLQQTVTLTGSSISTSPPTANPASLSFGDVQVGQNASQSVTVSSNQSAVTAQISGSNNYTVQPATCAQGASTCTFNVTFSPTATGLISGTLSLSSQGWSTNTSVPLTGSGIGTTGTGSSGSITLSPASLIFYQTNVPQTVTMTNSGLTPVAIQNFNISSSNWSQTNDCGTVLQAQSICTINIQSTNSALGTFTGTLTVADDDTNDAQVVQLNTDNETLAGTIDYGSWPIGTTAPDPLSPFVHGEVLDPQINSLVFTGSFIGSTPGDFTPYGYLTGRLQTPFTCYSDPVANSDGCYLYLLFTPSDVGTRSSLLVTNDGTYLLTGTGLPHGPHFFFESPTYNFGSTAPGTSAPLTIKLMSDGDAAATLLPPVISGPNASDFTVTSACGNNTLQPVGSASVTQHAGFGAYTQTGGDRPYCTITLAFNPSSTQSSTATLTQTASAGFSQTVTLVGNSSSNPPPTANPTSLSFGNVQRGTSTTQIVTVTSPNQAAVTAQIIGSSDYSVRPATCAQGATNCTFNIDFAPTSAGAITGTLSLSSPGSLTNTSVPLTGTGIMPIVSLSSRSLIFSLRSIGTTSLPQMITLTNTGTAPLHISNVAVTTANPGEFIASGCPGVVTAGQTCTLSVSFSPQVTGTRTGILQIFSDALTSPDTIQLSGIAQ